MKYFALLAFTTANSVLALRKEEGWERETYLVDENNMKLHWTFYCGGTVWDDQGSNGQIKYKFEKDQCQIQRVEDQKFLIANEDTGEMEWLPFIEILDNPIILDRFRVIRETRHIGPFGAVLTWHEMSIKAPKVKRSVGSEGPGCLNLKENPFCANDIVPGYTYSKWSGDEYTEKWLTCPRGYCNFNTWSSEKVMMIRYAPKSDETGMYQITAYHTTNRRQSWKKKGWTNLEWVFNCGGDLNADENGNHRNWYCHIQNPSDMKYLTAHKDGSYKFTDQPVYQNDQSSKFRLYETDGYRMIQALINNKMLKCSLIEGCKFDVKWEDRHKNLCELKVQQLKSTTNLPEGPAMTAKDQPSSAPNTAVTTQPSGLVNGQTNKCNYGQTAIRPETPTVSRGETQEL